MTMPSKYRTYRFHTGFSPSRPFSSRPSAGEDGKKRRTVLRVIRETRGTNVGMRACRSANRVVIDFFVLRVPAMQEVNLGRNRRSTACECNIPSMQMDNSRY